MQADTPSQTSTRTVVAFLSTRSGVLAALACIWLVHLLLNGWHLWFDRRGTAFFDAANHLDYVYQLVAGLRLAGLSGLWQELRNSAFEWPPLVYLVSGLLAHGVDPSLAAVRLYHIVFTAIYLVCTYAIGRRCGGRVVGVLAALVASFFPGAFGLSRQYGFDYPSAALTAAALVALLRSDNFGRNRASIWAGLMAGLALLGRGQAALFLVGPGLVMAGQIVLARRWGSLARMTMAVGLAATVSALWWWGKLGTLIEIFTVHTNASEVFLEADPSFWGGIKLYVGGLPLLITLPLTLLALPLAVVWWRRRGPHRLELLTMVVLPVVIHSAMAIRNIRYLLPILPLIAVMVACGALALRRSRLRQAVVTSLVVLAVLPALLSASSSARRALGCGQGLLLGHTEVNRAAGRDAQHGKAALLARALAKLHPDEGKGAWLGLVPDGRDQNLLMDLAVQMRAHLPNMLLLNGYRLGSPWAHDLAGRTRHRYVMLVQGTPRPADTTRRITVIRFRADALRDEVRLAANACHPLLGGVWRTNNHGRNAPGTPPVAVEIWRLKPTSDWRPPLQ